MFSSKRNLIFILIVATLLAYFSSLGNPFIWDDEQFITSNHYVHDFNIVKIFTTSTTAGSGVQSNYYRPLTTLSFAIDTAIWKVNPYTALIPQQDSGNSAFGFHLTNTLLHLGAGVLLFLLLEELFENCHSEAAAEESSSNNDLKRKILRFTQDDKQSSLLAFFIALFFLIHPIQTEAVTYINSRGDSLYALFLFSSLWLFVSSLRGAQATRQFDSSVILRQQPKNLISIMRSFAYAQDDNVIWARAFIVIFLYLCSILSKEIALTDCLLYVAVILLFSGRQKLSQSIQLYTPRRDLRFKIQELRRNIAQKKKGLITAFGTVVVAVGYWVVRLKFLNFANLLNFYGENTFYSTHLWVRLFTFCKVLWIYLGLLVWPYPLHMERSVDLVTSPFSWWVISIVVLFGILVGLGILELKKKKSAWILFGMSWFVITITPGSGIIPINGILYEHWLYVPSIGLWLMVFGLWQLLQSSLRGAQATRQSQQGMRLLHFVRNDGRKFLISFVLLLSILYLILTIRQNNIWSDPVRFYRYTLSFAPNSARLHNNLGMTLANEGRVNEAIPEYRKALSLGGTTPQTYNNLGNAYRVEGEYDKAEKYLKKALKLAPQFEVAKLNLIKLYLSKKEFNKAEELAKNYPAILQRIEEIKNNSL